MLQLCLTAPLNQGVSRLGTRGDGGTGPASGKAFCCRMAGWFGKLWGRRPAFAAYRLPLALALVISVTACAARGGDVGGGAAMAGWAERESLLRQLAFIQGLAQLSRVGARASAIFVGGRGDVVPILVNGCTFVG